MRRPSALTLFGLSAFAWIVVLMLVWTKVSPWVSYPVAALSHMALEQGAPMWVRTVHKRPGSMEVDTSIEVPVPQAGGRRAEISLEADPGRYAYGLPIFLALLLAARGPGRWSRAVGGYLLLLPVQAFSLSFYLLMQMVLSAQANARVLRVEQWQLESIVYGYQVGSLVLPTLAPFLLWLWLDRKFVEEVLVRAWQGRTAAASPVEVPTPAPTAMPAQAAAAAPVAVAEVAERQPDAGTALAPAAPPPQPASAQRGEISTSTAAVLPPRPSAQGQGVAR